MTDDHPPDASVIRDYDALVSGLAEILDLRGGLAAALDVAGYRALRAHVANALDLPAGLRAALATVRNAQPVSQPADRGNDALVVQDESGCDYRILGQTAIRMDGRMDDRWGPPRLRAMLAVLLLHPGRPVPFESLIEWAWPDDGPFPRDPLSTLHTYAARLRQSLRFAGGSIRLTVADGTLRLDVDRSAIDFYRFRELLAEARTLLRQGQPRQAADMAAQSIRLWHGRPLDDARSSRADNWRHWVVTEEWIPANITLLESLLELGEFNDVLLRLDDLQVEHPNDLALTKLRLTALHGLTRYVDATQYYLTARKQLLNDFNDRAAEHLRQFYGSLIQTWSQTGDPGQATGTIVPRQLPHDVADFVGRSELLRAISNASMTTSGDPAPRVIVLDGMAGVGKTSLAVHWAHSVRHQFPDGDFFVNLNGFSDSPSVTMSTVVENFLTALGHPPDSNQTQRSKEALLRQLLAGRRTLVILDNARDTTQVKDLVNLLSSSLIIVTSRQRLTTLTAVTGALRVRVEPMTAAEATTLLSTRLGERIPIDDRTHLAHLCGGLPLVISMLAEHLTTRPDTQLSEFARRLDRRELLTRVGDDADNLANAQTFFSWSYETLAAPERRLFRLLGLHPGPDISLEAARAYDGRPRAETQRSLGLLVGAHLLEHPEGPSRYRFHDLLREFAAQCAERDETPDARRAAERRAVDYYLAVATQAHRRLSTDHVPAPGLPIDDAVEPVVLADTAQAQSWFDKERTNLAEIIRFAAARGHHDHAWRLADTVAALFERRGYHANSRTVRELAVNSAEKLGDPKAQASSLISLGMMHIILGDHVRAQRCLELGLTFAKDNGSDRGQAAILHQMGRLDLLRDRPAAAITQYRLALDLLQRTDDHQGMCWTHCRLGEAHRTLGQHDQALVHLHEANWLAQRIGDESAHATILIELGSVYRERGDLHTAAAYCEQAGLIIDTMPVPDLNVTTQICTELAETNLRREDSNAAARHAQRAIALSQQTYDIIAEARAHDLLGDIQLANGEPGDAVAAWQLAVEMYERIGITSRAAVVRTKIDARSLRQSSPAITQNRN